MLQILRFQDQHPSPIKFWITCAQRL